MAIGDATFRTGTNQGNTGDSGAQVCGMALGLELLLGKKILLIEAPGTLNVIKNKVRGQREEIEIVGMTK